MAGGRSGFVHLRLHTEFSLLDSLCRLPGLIQALQRAGCGAAGIADRNSLHGALPFHREARHAGIKPLIGVELDLRRGPAPEPDPPAVVLIAESYAGYQNLVDLVSSAHLDPAAEAGRPALDIARLREGARDCVVLSGGPRGDIGRSLVRYDLAGAERRTRECLSWFGRDNFFLELQDAASAEGRRVNEQTRLLSGVTGARTVVTQDVHALHAADASAWRMLRRLREGTTAPAEPAPPGEAAACALRDPSEMESLFPEEADALAATREIATRCTVELPPRPRLRFPAFPLPAGFSPPLSSLAAGHRPEFEYLRQAATEGLRQRFGGEPPAGARERLATELAALERMGFVNYLLVLWDLARVARERVIPVGPGRGAGAGSLAAFALGVTNIDPLRHGLRFERFLDPEREGPPELDLEVAPERRIELIDHARRRYGPDRVAHVGALVTFGARVAVRDAARALGWGAEEADAVARLVPDEPHATLARAQDLRPELKRLAESDPRTARLLDLAGRVEGLPRNTTTHPAGIVIADGPVGRIVPAARERDGSLVTQYDTAGVAQAGLVRINLVGARVLAVLHEAVDAARRLGAEAPDVDRLPEDDPDTAALLERGDTTGVFHAESPGVRDTLRRAGVRSFADLVAALALHRPVPTPAFEDWIRRRRGEAPADPPDPRLEPLLRDTSGLPLFQEQILDMLAALTGLPSARCERMRRAMTPAMDPDSRETFRDEFARAARKAHRLSRDDADRLFNILEAAAPQSVLKAGGAATAWLVWRAAWMKRHHPAPWFAALLARETPAGERVSVLVAEARRLGLAVRRPDTNRTDGGWTTDGRNLFAGVSAVRQVGADLAAAIVLERRAGGRFKGLLDFCRRLAGAALNRPALEHLVAAGAFDFTRLARPRLTAGLDIALRHASAVRQDLAGGQGLLFPVEAGAGARDGGDAALPDAPPWPADEQASRERHALGFLGEG